MKRIPLNSSTFGEEEITVVLGVLKSTQVTMDGRCAEFERVFGEFIRRTEAIFVNSGSSANLLAFFALANFAAPELSNRRKFVPGSEVIVPAVSWSTTFWPIIQAGGVPVLVDSDPQTLQMRVEAMPAALSSKTVAICPVHVLGNAVAMDEVVCFAEEHRLWVVEDACEALGSKYRGRPAGSFGDLATFSFFFSHHITTIEGGMIVTGNPEIAELLRCLRAHGWTRNLKRRNEIKVEYPEIDDDYLFINMGFNLRPTEINAALGLIQLTKLERFNRRRNEIAASWNEAFGSLMERGVFHSMASTKQADAACFGYPVVCRTPTIRQELKRHLQEHGIETRPIVCGNMARQPVFSHVPHRISGDLSGANQIMDCGLLWGLHPLMSDEDVQYVADTVLEAAQHL
jgi:dTDP-4-amino-4,6-dideoxygalactose transaminase